MGADLFGSCAESTCAAMVISAVAFGGNVDALLYPIVISAIGIPVSLITILLIRVNTEAQVGPALKRMLIISSVPLMAAVMYFVTGHAGAGGFRNQRCRVYLPRRIPVLPDRTHRRPRCGPAHRVLHVGYLQTRS